MVRISRITTLSLLMLAGCVDATMPRSPSPVTTPGAPNNETLTADQAYPRFHSVSEVPSSFGLATIYDVRPLVYWQGSVANASAAMDYWGNVANQRLTLTLSKGGSQVYTREATSHEGNFVPVTRTLTTPGFTARVSGTCGHVANLATAHVAKVVVIVDIEKFTELSVAERPGGASAMQPSCASSPCTSTVSNDQTSYGGDFDPYAPSSGSCDGGSGIGTSGTQFEVGDYTGGQTVNWKTGVGTGSPSACGDQARVDYICVEYNTGDGWKSLDCGYVTTC